MRILRLLSALCLVVAIVGIGLLVANPHAQQSIIAPLTKAVIYDSGGTEQDIVGALENILNAMSQDATHDSAAKNTGPQVMGECDDTSTDAVDEGDAGRLRINCTSRALMTESGDPCGSSSITKTTVGFSKTADGELIDGTSALFTRICSIVVVANAAEQVSLEAETDDGSCDKTSGTALLGDGTDADGPSFAVNGGFTYGNGGGTVFVTPSAAQDVCIYLNGTNRVSGTVSYVQSAR